MAETKKATVYIYLSEGPVPAGLLSVNCDGRYTTSEFIYGKRYLERPDAIPVDPVQLPLPAPGRSGVVQTPADFAIFNGIRDAAPDKWGRYLLDKKFPALGLDEFDYVAASGPDRVGALAFGESPVSGVGIWDTKRFAAQNSKYFDLALIQRAVDGAEDPDDPDFQRFLEYGPSLGGARPKATVRWNGCLCLAKFSLSNDTYNVCQAEYAAMLLANRCGIDVPRIYLSEVLNRQVFIIERFDRQPESKNGVIRRPFHSALTMTGSHESDYMRHSYLDIVTAISRYSSQASRDRNELFRRLAFNIFCNNNDDHMRNHGFLYAGDGAWNLSPAYDLVPSPQSGEAYHQALHFGEAGREASLKNLQTAAPAFGLNLVETNHIIDEVREGMRNWQELYVEHGASAEDIVRLKSCFRPL
ncbi:MAG: type II toxin-antitoxin system HipA family toxin [Thermodesulfobacteriota bacterium]|nr:type II toxin-antitoxin system HipA family toxin [Thermodesulfobacteriota bacterium]